MRMSDWRSDLCSSVRRNRPDKLCAVVLAMWRRLGEVANALSAEEVVRCVVVTGAGKGFGAGADIGEFSTVRGTPEKAQAYGTVMVDALFALRDCPNPPVERIPGHCTGPGLDNAEIGRASVRGRVCEYA